MKKERVRVVCPSGHQLEADLFRRVNVTQVPETRDQIVADKLNRARCPTCGTEFYADVPFLYHDMGTGLRVWVYPERDRDAEETILGKIRRAATLVGSILPTDRSGPELVFGLDELRDLIRSDRDPAVASP